jgi:hypothetical protein
MSNSIYPLLSSTTKEAWLPQPEKLQLLYGHLLLLNPKDIELFDKILNFKESRINLILNDPRINGSTLKGEYYLISNPEEVNLAKSTFYKYPTADALINSLYYLRKYHYVIEYPKQDKNDKDYEFHEQLRSDFEMELLKAGLVLEKEISYDKSSIFLKLFVPFGAQIAEAVKMRLRFQLKAPKLPSAQPKKHSTYSILSKYLQDRVNFDLLTEVINPRDLDRYEGATNNPEGLVNMIDNFVSNTRQQLIADSILMEIKVYSNRVKHKKSAMSLSKLLLKKVFTNALLLHDGSYKTQKQVRNLRTELYQDWSKQFFQKQPFDKIREYFGEKIALYFSWLGFYTVWLAISALVGTVVFCYGFFKAFYQTNRNNQATLLSRAIDNELTIPFALFISLWSTFYLEFWKRKNAILAYNWDVKSFEKEEETRPEWIPTHMKVSKVTGKLEPHYPESVRLMKIISGGCFVLICVLLVIATIIGLIVIRVKIGPPNGALVASIVNFVLIMIYNALYNKAAIKLTDWENHRTMTEYENAIIAKCFVFDFVNFYGTLFYLAFFKGTIKSIPTLEEICGTEPNSSCLPDVFTQLAIIFTAKQVYGQIMEVGMPFIKQKLNEKQSAAEKEQFLAQYQSFFMEQFRLTDDDVSVNKGMFKPPQWVKDIKLASYESVTDDYKEMGKMLKRLSSSSSIRIRYNVCCVRFHSFFYVARSP